jgi:CheY-like chemotaxis protein
MIIWLIDDDYITNYVNQLLISDVYPDLKVEIFENAEIALDLILRNEARPDIILLDINMPMFDGWDFLNGMALNEVSIASPPIIYMLSSSISEADRKKALSFILVEGYLIKPLEKETLRSVIEK